MNYAFTRRYKNFCFFIITIKSPSCIAVIQFTFVTIEKLDRRLFVLLCVFEPPLFSMALMMLCFQTVKSYCRFRDFLRRSIFLRFIRIDAYSFTKLFLFAGSRSLIRKFPAFVARVLVFPKYSLFSIRKALSL